MALIAAGVGAPQARAVGRGSRFHPHLQLTGRARPAARRPLGAPRRPQGTAARPRRALRKRAAPTWLARNPGSCFAAASETTFASNCRAPRPTARPAARPSPRQREPLSVGQPSGQPCQLPSLIHLANLCLPWQSRSPREKIWNLESGLPSAAALALFSQSRPSTQDGRWRR